MAEPSFPRLSPEDIELRVKPRRVTRINRKVLIGSVAVGALLLFGAFLFALNPPDWRGKQASQELYNTDRKAIADGLSKLPSTYDAIPKLGPPAPGDFGDALQKVESGKGAELPLADRPFQADPEADLQRAERIRLARLGQQGRESKLFYSVNAKPSETVASRPAPASTETTGEPSPFDALATAASNAPTGVGTAAPQPAAPGFQDHKLAFLNAKPDAEIYNTHAQQKPISPYTLMAGTIIPASLLTGLNSDLPGFVIGQVTENVYDTVTGRYLLVPQGTRIIGKYDSVVAFGQKRALIVWQRIIRPDGSSIVIENLPATDEGGYAGLEGGVDFHTWQILKGVGLATLLGVGTELSIGGSQNDLVSAIRQSAFQNIDRASQNVVQRMLDIQPTLTIRPGFPLRIIVHKDIILTPYPQAR